MSSTDRLNTALGDRYRIERELGAGGMATVYLAHDVRHDRKVALKVLRPELSAILGGERFLAEIKTTANLQHPHILSLFDSGEADGTVFYVMPYVEGETLRDRIKREHQLPVDEAVRIAREVLDALEYAHRQGIVHRDIKPENILLHGGHAMVADFGIALAASRSEGGTRMTETGMSLGTPHYMSPEQAMGDKEITGRADVYAVGCVLYEMLSGEPPFVGATAQAIFARVLTDEPRSLAIQRKTIPTHVADAVHVALEKLPADRFASAADFASALSGTDAVPTRAAVRSAATARRPLASMTLAAVGIMSLVAAVIVAVNARRDAGPGRGPVAVLSVNHSTAERGAAQGGVSTNTGVALAPDGSAIVYSAQSASGQVLYVRRLAEPTSTPLRGTEGAISTFFSADGRFLWFGGVGGVRRVALVGGTPLLTTFAAAFEDLFGKTPSLTLDSSGVVAIRNVRTNEVIRPDSSRREIALAPQAILPDGRLLVIAQTQGMSGSLILIDPSSGERRTITNSLTSMATHQDGLIAWTLSNGTLLAAPLDASGDLSTSATVIADNVSVSAGSPPSLAFSKTGSLVYVPAAPSELVRVNRAGTVEVIGLEPRRYHNPRVSPDGRSVLVDVTDEERDVWLLSLTERSFTRLTFDRTAHDPEWLPDGRRFLYAATVASGVGVRLRSVDGVALDSMFVPSAGLSAHSAARDGQTAYAVSSGQNAADIVRIDFGKHTVEDVVATRFNEVYPTLSPDGRFLAYTSDESGREEVYIRSLTSAARIPVSRAGGTEPVWSGNGRELFYRDPDGPTLVAAAVELAPTLRVTGRTRLFGLADFEAATPHPNYDVTPDGKFIFVRTIAPTSLTYIQNWPAMVKRQAR